MQDLVQQQRELRKQFLARIMLWILSPSQAILDTSFLPFPTHTLCVALCTVTAARHP